MNEVYSVAWIVASSLVPLFALTWATAFVRRLAAP